MIIITSNGDLIDRLSLNKSESTRIIDLDTNNLANTIFKVNNNLLDLTFLAELSELNSTNAQMYKRVLNSPQYSRSKVPKLSQGEIDLYFFVEKLRCRNGQNQCSIADDSDQLISSSMNEHVSKFISEIDCF
ncbi:unnamed protein product [Rotaria magnacalcarata]